MSDEAKIFNPGSQDYATFEVSDDVASSVKNQLTGILGQERKHILFEDTDGDFHWFNLDHVEDIVIEVNDENGKQNP